MTVNEQSGRFQVARCTAGERQYLVDLSRVVSIQQSNVVKQPPTREQPAGRLETGQGSIPVFSLAHLLGGQWSSPTVRAYCLIVNHEGRRWGLMVDQLHKSTELPRNEVMSLPHDLQADWFWGAVASSVSQSENQLLLLLNPAAIDSETNLSLGGGNSTGTSCRTQLSEPIGIAASTRQLVLFDLVQNHDRSERTCLALSAAQVAEVTSSQPLTPLPHAPHGVLGLMAWRGRAVPVVNIPSTLGLQEQSLSRLTRIAVARRPLSDDYIAFVAPNGIRTQILSAATNPIRASIDIESRALLGAFSVGKETMLVPDLDQMFSAGRTQSVAV